MKNFAEYYAQKITFCFGSGVACWVLLLLKQLQIIKGSNGNYSLVRCGPFLLSEVTKQQTIDGFTIHLSVKPGLLLFILCWVVLGAAWGFVIYRIHKHFVHKNV